MKAAAVPSVRSIAHDFLELTKPRLTLFVLIVVFVSGYLAAGRHIDFFVLLNAISGAALVGGGAFVALRDDPFIEGLNRST